MSKYLPEKRALFLHIPRTGGTWLSDAMVHAGIPIQNRWRVAPIYRQRKHTIPIHYDPRVLAEVDWCFSFVRHPLKYYVSVWRFTHRCIVRRPEEMRIRLLELKDPSVICEAEIRWRPNFEEWLEEMIEEEPGWMTRHVERYVGPPRGEFCHYIGRTETLERDAAEVMSILGYERRWEEALPRIQQITWGRNVVNSRLAPEVTVPPELVERLLRSERVLIRRFYGDETKGKRIYRNQKGEPI